MLGVKSKVSLICLLCLFMITFSMSSVFAVDIVNSKSWEDVYAVMLSSAITEESSVFIKSESLSALTKVITIDEPVTIYQSNDEYIPNLGSQLSALGYTVVDEISGNNFNSVLDIDSGRYILVSNDNYRITPSLAPFAKQTQSWVLFVSDENINEIVDTISSANSVLAVGKFKRDLFSAIEPFVTDSIDTGSVFSDSVAIGSRFAGANSVVITDAKALESELFNTQSPVLISGTNKLPDETFEYLTQSEIKSAVLIGNQLAVVGEDIRSKSNKEISVFIKFGQSDAKNVGSILALSFFPLPVDNPVMRITNALVDIEEKVLTVLYENTGNVGLYELSTIQLLSEGETILTVSDESPQYLGAGETLRISYDISELDAADITEDVQANFFTSFGIVPSALDTFLTNPGEFVPPYTTSLELGSVPEDGTQLNITDIAYFKGYKRIGVTVENVGTEPAFYSVRLYDLIVNGIEQTLDKSETKPLAPGEVRTTFIPVELDEIDLVDNTDFNIELRYGSNTEFAKTFTDTRAFIVNNAINPLLVTGMGVVLLLLVAVIMFFILKRR